MYGTLSSVTNQGRASSRARLPAQEPLELGRRHKPDYWLVALVLMLLVIGLIVIFSISPALSAIGHVSSGYYVNRQLLAVGIGLIAFVAAA